MAKSATRTPRQPKGDYKVGYCRTPVSTRFKPGDIGNPKGRPKKKKPIGQTIEEELAARVRIEQNGHPRTVSVLTLIIRQLMRTAAKGDPRSIQTVFNLVARYRDSSETAFDLADLEPQDRAIIQEYYEQFQRRATQSEPENSQENGSADHGHVSKGQPEQS